MFAPVRSAGCLLTTAVCLCFSAAQAAEPPPKPAEDAALKRKVEELIASLGHEDFQTREKAAVELRTLDARALPYLEPHADSSNPEVAGRLKLILPRLRAGGLFDNPLHRAAEGDWAEYLVEGHRLQVTGQQERWLTEVRSTVRLTVKEKDDGRVVIEVEETDTGPQKRARTLAFALAGIQYCPPIEVAKPIIEGLGLRASGQAQATLTVAGKKLDCQTVRLDRDGGPDVRLTFSPTVPVFGIAHVETLIFRNGNHYKTVTALKAWGRKGEPPPEKKEK